MEVYTVKVEEGKLAEGNRPSFGPVYRNIYAKDGLLESPAGIESPWELFSGSAKRYPQNQMLGRREVIDGKAGGYVWQTYEEVYEMALKIGSGLRECGVNLGDRCGIYGSNCPEWVIAMEACNSQGICCVSLYDSLGPNAVEFIINHSEVSVAFVQENKIHSILMCLPKCAIHLKTIVSFGVVTDQQKREVEEAGVSCFSWKEFVSLVNVPYKVPPKNKNDICTIMYTSGTTGEPKGVILTNKAIIAEVINNEHMLLETDKVFTEEDSYFSYLPLAHVFDQIFENYCIYKGASIGFWQGDVRYLMEDIQQLKPTLFCGVPRIYDRIYTGINQKIESGGMLSKKIFQYAYDHKLRNMKRGLKQDEASPFLDRLIFHKIRQVMGGRVRMMISGAAPIPKHVEEFLRVTTCSVFIQGYGLTESCSGCFTCIANVFSMMGTVGVPITTIEAKLVSVPEMGYDANSDVPRGEICLRGNTLFSGYHKRQDLIDEVLIDGWFHTGDIGEWLPNGAMKIIDRKKNIFKLSQGEYVAPEVLESAYMQCPLVTSVWVYGNSFESFLVGVAIPEKKSLEEWAAANDVSGNFEELCKHQKSRKYILEELNNVGRKYNLKGFEMLKAVHLEPRPFDMGRDLITPTFKLKRPQLLKFFKARRVKCICYFESVFLFPLQVYFLFACLV
ncbi:long chain acyl-CoA synthetase 2 [Canna indica]|uniref:Long-chain-fatty-acid--CoA ligase n=1 Tax=Canna indica TaxID=4628 RepID=A0AAQ3L9B4_9LILI|nr:long chain acyl-CoA synthetase 2 [Canna indica]